MGSKMKQHRFTCGVRHDIELLLMQCIAYASERDLLFAALLARGQGNTTVDDLSFPEGGSRSFRETFILVLRLLPKSGSSNVF